MEANWIKPRRETTQVFMITSMNDKLPEFLEKRTKVYEYKDRPMLCKKCWKYGHTEKRCLSQVVLCGRCAGPGHQSGGCISEVAKCGNCGGAHISGQASCLNRKKKQIMLEIQKHQKVGRALARQIVETGINIHTCSEERKPYAGYIDIEIDPNEKRKLCPFKVEKKPTE